MAEGLWGSAYPVASSILAYPEGRAALALAHRVGRLDRRAYNRSLSELEEIYEGLIALGLDEQLAREASGDADAFGLRGYDAVHLATALEIQEEEVVFVTWDRDLARAAEGSGLAGAGA